jgi:hypothetical protein
MATAKTARSVTICNNTTSISSGDEIEQPLAITLRPFILEALPRLRRIGRLPDAALLDSSSPLAPLGRQYRDPSHYRMLARGLTHLVGEDRVWQRVGASQRTWIVLDFLQVAGALFAILDAQEAPTPART